MKTTEFAWLIIRSLGLICAILSLKFALGTGFGIYATYPYRDYSSVTISSSELIPPQEDASNPETKRNHDLYNYFNQITMNNGFWFVILAGSGLYLTFGGRLVHRIVTRLPQDRNERKEIESGR
jgi:hypothetical protein